MPEHKRLSYEAIQAQDMYEQCAQSMRTHRTLLRHFFPEHVGPLSFISVCLAQSLPPFQDAVLSPLPVSSMVLSNPVSSLPLANGVVYRSAGCW